MVDEVEVLVRIWLKVCGSRITKAESRFPGRGDEGMRLGEQRDSDETSKGNGSNGT